MSILGGFPPRGGAVGKGMASQQSEVIAITEREFESEVIHSDTPVLIGIVSQRSSVCRQIAPEVEAFARDVVGKIKVVSIDVDESPNIVRELRIQQVPTFILFAEKRIADAAAGPVTKKQLQAMVDPYMPRAAGAVKPAELAQFLAAGVFVPIDTREAAAFKRAHLPNAVSIPEEELDKRLADLEALAGRPILYCRSGDKSKDAAKRLGEQGFPIAYLEGGMLAWESDSLPIERG